VWFNAWHHQREEHLFAALLEAVRRQAVPSLLRWAGVVVRFRLFWGRVRTRRFAWLLGLVGITAILGAVSAMPLPELSTVWKSIRGFSGGVAPKPTDPDYWKDLFTGLAAPIFGDEGTKPMESHFWKDVVAGLVAPITTIAGIFAVLNAFRDRLKT